MSQRVSLNDPSVAGSRKYVSQPRDVSDALAPGHKFGYWGPHTGPLLDPLLAVNFADGLADTAVDVPAAADAATAADVVADDLDLSAAASSFDALNSSRCVGGQS